MRLMTRDLPLETSRMFSSVSGFTHKAISTTNRVIWNSRSNLERQGIGRVSTTGHLQTTKLLCMICMILLN